MFNRGTYYNLEPKIPRPLPLRRQRAVGRRLPVIGEGCVCNCYACDNRHVEWMSSSKDSQPKYVPQWTGYAPRVRT